MRKLLLQGKFLPLAKFLVEISSEISIWQRPFRFRSRILNGDLRLRSEIGELKLKSTGPDAAERAWRESDRHCDSDVSEGGCNIFGKRPVGSPAAKNKKQQTRTLFEEDRKQSWQQHVKT